MRTDKTIAEKSPVGAVVAGDVWNRIGAASQAPAVREVWQGASLNSYHAESWNDAQDALDEALFVYGGVLVSRKYGIPYPDMSDENGSGSGARRNRWCDTGAVASEIEALFCENGLRTLVGEYVKAEAIFWWSEGTRRRAFDAEGWAKRVMNDCPDRDAQAMADMMRRAVTEWRNWAIRRMGWFTGSMDNAKKGP